MYLMKETWGDFPSDEKSGNTQNGNTPEKNMIFMKFFCCFCFLFSLLLLILYCGWTCRKKSSQQSLQLSYTTQRLTWDEMMNCWCSRSDVFCVTNFGLRLKIGYQNNVDHGWEWWFAARYQHKIYKMLTCKCKEVYCIQKYTAKYEMLLKVWMAIFFWIKGVIWFKYRYQINNFTTSEWMHDIYQYRDLT